MAVIADDIHMAWEDLTFQVWYMMFMARARFF